MTDILADPVRGVVSLRKRAGPATGTQPKGGLDDPPPASLAMTFIGELDQNCDQLAIVEQHQRIFVGAVGSYTYLVG
jgi:hypothetical protein